MDSNWVEITEPSALAQVLHMEIPVATQGAYSLLSLLSDDAVDQDGWWRSVDDSGPRPPQHGFGYQILKTRYFFNVTEARRVGGDLLLAGAAYVQTQTKSFPCGVR